MLFDRGKRRLFTVPFSVVANNNPAFTTDNCKPFIIWHIVFKIFHKMRSNLKRRL